MCFGSEWERGHEEGIGNSGRLRPDIETNGGQGGTICIFFQVPVSQGFLLFSVISVYILGFLLFLHFYQQSKEVIKPRLPFVFGENFL